MSNNANISKLQVKLKMNELELFMFAPITSCDVERSFSKLKAILTSKRIGLTFENLKMIFVIYYN